MTITGEFVLKHGVVLIPCAELSDDMRGRIAYEEGDVTLLHRHGRGYMHVIDAETAALLELFRRPRTIADAVLENSRALGKPPGARFDELLPHLDVLLHRRVLVPAGSAEEQEVRPRFDGGDVVAGWTIVRCVNLVEDTDVYEVERAGQRAALKIARLATAAMAALFDHEAAVLRHLGGCEAAPALLDAGVDEGGQPYLITAWLDGVSVDVAAAQRRNDRAALLDLAASIAAAYASLHARGVLHGDVYWRNAVAGRTVALVDFGRSRMTTAPAPAEGRGMMMFFEPEFAAAQRQGRSLAVSEAGEQYAIAALLYLLLTGEHYLDFRYERDEMLRQIECEAPLPFAARGLAPWPEVEPLLLRALEKEPSRRYASTAEMAAALAGVRDDAARLSPATPPSPTAAALLESTLRSFSRGGTMFASRYPAAPTASINYGCAGAAAGLLRIAEVRGDAALLALANVWRSRAEALIGTEGAFYDADAGLPRERVGDVSPYHTEAGVHAAAAMIFAAFGHRAAQESAAATFIAASARPCSNLDLTLGRSGSLLAASMLWNDLSDFAPLRAFGSETMRAIWNELEARPAIGERPDDALGMAHGWGGILYAALRWCAASGDPLPPRLRERLGELALLRRPRGRGICWPSYAGDEAAAPLAATWCNGSAGLLFLFVLAHRAFGDDEWLRLAELCAWTAWDEPRAMSDLCCGTAGRAYALLNLYKHTGQAEWLGRACQLANDAAASATATAMRANALWKGELGVAVLIADLASPETARMPFFE